MKRSDLKVGDEVYYDRSPNWQEYTYGAGRAVIVDVRRYDKVRSFISRTGYVLSLTGNAVLVRFHEEGKITAVPVVHLRGLWQETKAAVDKLVEARREEAGKESAARDAQASHAHKLKLDLRQLGSSDTRTWTGIETGMRSSSR